MLVAICLRLCSHGNAAGHALRMGCCHVGVACETACRTECWQLRCRPCATMHVARVTFLLLTLEFEFKLLSSFTFPHLSPMTKMRLWVFIVSFEPIDGVGCGSVFCGPWLVHLLLSLSDPVRAIRRQDKEPQATHCTFPATFPATTRRASGSCRPPDTGDPSGRVDVCDDDIVPVSTSQERTADRATRAP